MKYVIVYLIKGEAKKYQVNLINELTKKFNLVNLNNTIMPHFTLKYFSQPVNADNLIRLERILDDFSKNASQFNFSLSGFGNFNKEVIFTKAHDEKLEKFYKKFVGALKKLDWIKFGKYEKGRHNFHSTIAYIKSHKQFYRVEGYLLSKNPRYKLKFDNITILKKPKNKWIVHKEFKI